jgi:hypothetical protein
MPLDSSFRPEIVARNQEALSALSAKEEAKEQVQQTIRPSQAGAAKVSLSRRSIKFSVRNRIGETPKTSNPASTKEATTILAGTADGGMFEIMFEQQLSHAAKQLEDVATLLSGGSLLLSLVVDGVARSATITTAFGLIPSGGIGLVIDSYGMLAIAKDQDSAARDVGVGVGDQVVLRAGEASQVSTAVHIGKKSTSE